VPYSHLHHARKACQPTSKPKIYELKQFEKCNSAISTLCWPVYGEKKHKATKCRWHIFCSILPEWLYSTACNEIWLHGRYMWEAMMHRINLQYMWLLGEEWIVIRLCVKGYIEYIWYRESSKCIYKLTKTSFHFTSKGKEEETYIYLKCHTKKIGLTLQTYNMLIILLQKYNLNLTTTLLNSDKS
jgi:hypothetical protein